PSTRRRDGDRDRRPRRRSPCRPCRGCAEARSARHAPSSSRRRAGRAARRRPRSGTPRTRRGGWRAPRSPPGRARRRRTPGDVFPKGSPPAPDYSFGVDALDEATVSAILARARAAWPKVALPEDTFVAHLEERASAFLDKV